MSQQPKAEPNLMQKVTGAFTSVPHTAPDVTHRKKLLIALTSAAPQMPDHRTGWFLAEALHPYEEFTRQGWDVDFVSETGTAQVDEASIGKMASGGDLAKWNDAQFPMHAKLAQLRSAAQINPAEYSLVYFAGGHGCCADFPSARGLKSLAAAIYESGGVVAAVCHGPAIFQGLTLSSGEPILRGREATGFAAKAEESMGAMSWLRENGYRTMEEIVNLEGGKWSEATNPMGEYVRVADRVVTGMNPASAKAVAVEALKFLPHGPEFTPVKEGTTQSTMLGKGCEAPTSSTVGSSTLAGDKTRAETVGSDDVAKQRGYQGERSTAI